MNPDIRTIKTAISPADFYQYELPDMPSKNKGGWRDGGLCPFHADNHAGSFRVNMDTGGYCCFSCNAKGGDVVAFTMQREGLTFPNALKQLAEDWGV
jgi:DNA primase